MKDTSIYQQGIDRLKAAKEFAKNPPPAVTNRIQKLKMERAQKVLNHAVLLLKIKELKDRLL